MDKQKELELLLNGAEEAALHLSAHCALFDGYYGEKDKLEQAVFDPETFYASWNDIYEKVDALYGQIVQANRFAKGGMQVDF